MKVTKKQLQWINIDDIYFGILKIVKVKYKNKFNFYFAIIEQNWFDENKDDFEQDWQIVRTEKIDGVDNYFFVEDEEFETVLDKLEESWFPQKFEG